MTVKWKPFKNYLEDYKSKSYISINNGNRERLITNDNIKAIVLSIK